ncbi:hypothetical protein GYMLUDRAFT_114760, partial [Collybiopsis luxurians FD-317 M1]
KSKPKDPEVFKGSDPQKFKSFIISLALTFLDKLNYFTEQWKINYTLSYLSDSAKEWSEPDILEFDLSNMPAWTSTFSVLVQELQDNFRVYNAQGEAEDKLREIKMKDSDTV